MGLLNKILSGSRVEGLFFSPEEQLKLLEQGIGMLRLSTFYCLQKKYLPSLSLQEANALAASVVSMLVLEAPSDALRLFFDANKKKIAEEIRELHEDEQLSGPAGCASYLLAAEILYAKMVKTSQIADSNQVWKSNTDLLEQGQSLGIFIPTDHSICGSDQPAKCIPAIHNFARLFYYTNTWTGPSPALPDAPVQAIDYRKTLLEISKTLPAPTPHTAKDQSEILPGYGELLESRG